ncbi:TPA: hypothetical protein ACPSKZ_000224 [Legionella anisa]|uniref:hypothetical protein n=1 Tax=Legionella anisa TaxID=28082 RepID=UPI000346C562|nr:hypothetical protein [Legionella anisa]AWN72646.1 hypothetical protein DLD14_01625 [Legionella anisa]MCW8423426.1 hypothetical protein [Legionella anisa]MCW8446946.1 hypothetical protein [Legionella anisa]
MMQNRAKFSISTNQDHLPSKQLHQLFSKLQFNVWLEGFVNFLNKSNMTPTESVAVVHNWNMEQLYAALDYFSNSKFVGLVNAIFFYKMHPDQLFADVIHPEKLISIQVRLELLHYYIELLQRQLYEVALQNELTPGVDYFLHDEELPPGIMIEENEEFRQMIQTAVKGLKLNSNLTHTKRAIDGLHDLRRAYKFWFNPNRFIDAAMLLQQNLLSEVLEQERSSIILQEKLVGLYSQLTTTDCLDLYGYFANNDTHNLLYAFFNIARGGTFEWLSLLNNDEKTAVIEVFNAMCCVMEALRIELRKRHLLTEPYQYDLIRPDLEIDQRNRNAVFRVIKIYKRTHVIPGDVIEQLFQHMEQTD